MRLTLFICFLSFSVFGQSDINKLVLFDDFIATPTTTGNIFQTTASSGTAGSIDIPTAGIQGLLRLSTSTSASGRVHVGTYTNALTAGAGEWNVQIRLDTINVLCDNTERYAILIGFFDTYTGVNQFDGMYFLYDSIGVTSGSASSDKWQTVTINNGATTSFITTSKLVSTSGGTFGINVNAGGTSVDYVIDGEVVRTETTGVVSGAGRTFGLGVMIIKSAGTTARFCYVDYINAEYVYQRYGR